MSLTNFLKDNVVDPYQEVDYVVSDRFVDDEANPIKWKLKPMDPDAALELTEISVITDPKTKKADFKTSLYQKNVVLKTVIYPNLNDAGLQDSYGVMNPGALISRMLNADEFNGLLSKCMDVNGLSKSFEDKKDEVKN